MYCEGGPISGPQIIICPTCYQGYIAHGHVYHYGCYQKILASCINYEGYPHPVFKPMSRPGPHIAA